MKHFRVNRIIRDQWGVLIDELADETEDTVQEVEQIVAAIRASSDNLALLAKIINGDKE